MRKICCLISLLFCLAFAPLSAEVLVQDPNTGGDTKQETERVDERLLQPVTYQVGYKRLHDVADELTRLTGVRVSSGRNNSDWQVRDIPLVVCVKDMPLGKLLKMVAAAAHVQLASETVGKEDPKPVYRFIRTREGEKELTDPRAARIEANRKLASWAWDVMAAYGKLPDTPVEISREYYDNCPDMRDENGNRLTPAVQQIIAKSNYIDPEAIRLAAQVIASLDPEVKEKVFAGEQVTIPASGSDAIKKLFVYACGNLDKPMMAGYEPITDPTSEEISNSRLMIKLHERHERDRNAGLSFLLDGVPFKTESGFREHDPWSGCPVAQARALAYTEGLDLPPAPDVDDILLPKNAPPFAGAVRLADPESWKLPPLQEKVELDLPQEWNVFPCAQVLSSLAGGSGCDIICEDFTSHRLDRRFYTGKLGKSPTLGAVLKQAKDSLGLDLYMDESSRLIVAYAENWRDRHRNLIPEKTLNELHSKLDGNGAELDDMTVLFRWSDESIQEWVSTTAQVYGFSLSLMQGEGRGVWRLYDSLSNEDKKLAKSKAGLPLAKLDVAWVSDMLRQQIEESDKSVVFLSGDSKRPDSPLLDPELLRNLIMHVRSKPLGQFWAARQLQRPDALNWRPEKGDTRKHEYEIVLSGKHNGQEFEKIWPWYDSYFPRFTPKKEAELFRQMQEDAGKKQ